MTDEDRRKLEEDDFLGLSPTTDELKPGEQLVRNPTDVWVEDWLKIDGVKSYWFCNIQLAEEAGFKLWRLVFTPSRGRTCAFRPMD